MYAESPRILSTCELIRHNSQPWITLSLGHILHPMLSTTRPPRPASPLISLAPTKLLNLAVATAAQERWAEGKPPHLPPYHLGHDLPSITSALALNTGKTPTFLAHGLSAGILIQSMLSTSLSIRLSMVKICQPGIFPPPKSTVSSRLYPSLQSMNHRFKNSLRRSTRQPSVT